MCKYEPKKLKELQFSFFEPNTLKRKFKIFQLIFTSFFLIYILAEK